MLRSQLMVLYPLTVPWLIQQALTILGRTWISNWSYLWMTAPASLLVGEDMVVIADTLSLAGLQVLVVYVSPKELEHILLVLKLVIVELYIVLWAICSRLVKAWSWSLYPTIMMSSAMIIACLILQKHSSSMHWNKHITGHCSSNRITV